MTVTHDVPAIAGELDEESGLRTGGVAGEIRSAHDVNGLCARWRTAQRSYFGEDVAGYTSGRTVNNLAAMIAILRGEDADAAYVYAGRAESKDELVDELVVALEESGFDGVDIGVNSIGPLLPLMLAILQETHEVSIPHALGHHKEIVEGYDFE